MVRQLHVLAMKLYQKIWKAGSVENFMDIFVDCLECHHAAYVEGKTLQHDLSENNLVFKDTTKRKKGILNDWDMASWLDDQNEAKLSNATHRTGTVPFMAIDLLVETPPAHLYRHDLESFLYILIWAALHYDPMEFESRLRTYPFYIIGMVQSSTALSAPNTASLLNKTFLGLIEDGCNPLVQWITKLWRLFHGAAKAYQEHQLASLNHSPNRSDEADTMPEWDHATCL